MGIKLGDISPLAGAITGKGMFGKGLAKLGDSGMGMLVPMSLLASKQRKKALTRAEDAAGARRGAVRGRPMVEEAMMIAEAPEGTMMRKGGKVKAKPVKKMAKGGSTASKRADGCATKGKTKGRFV